jgi:hypothetical protein
VAVSTHDKTSNPLTVRRRTVAVAVAAAGAVDVVPAA